MVKSCVVKKRLRMVSNRRFFFEACSRPPKGLALGMILLAIVLLAAIAVAIAVSARGDNGNAATEKNKTLASAIIQQGNTIKAGYDNYSQTMGVSSCYIALWDNSVPATTPVGHWYGLYDPTYSNILHQYPPPDAFADPTGATWMWKYSVCVPLVHEPGFTANEAVIAPDLTQGVCQQINQALYGTTAVPTSTEALSVWEVHTVGSTVYPSNANQAQACVSTSDGHYVYYTFIN